MNDALPHAIGAALQRHMLTSGRAAWILVDAECRLLEQGGEYARLGLPELAPGSDPRRVSDLVDALLDPHADYEVLPRVELVPGIATDVHRGRLSAGGAFLLLFDVSEDASSETLLRQRGLDLGRLLRGLGADAFQRTRVGVGWEEALQAASKEGPQRREHVAAIRVRILDSIAADGETEELDPAEALVRRESLLVRVLEALMERTGMAELDGCWAVQSWCGIVLEARDPAERALDVAASLPGLFAATHPGGVPIAVGVATGPAIVGTLSLPGGLRLALLGACAERAAVLAEQAGPGEVLVDETTAKASRGARVALEERGATVLGGVAHGIR